MLLSSLTLAQALQIISLVWRKKVSGPTETMRGDITHLLACSTLSLSLSLSLSHYIR